MVIYSFYQAKLVSINSIYCSKKSLAKKKLSCCLSNRSYDGPEMSLSLQNFFTSLHHYIYFPSPSFYLPSQLFHFLSQFLYFSSDFFLLSFTVFLLPLIVFCFSIFFYFSSPFYFSSAFFPLLCFYFPSVILNYPFEICLKETLKFCA